MLFPILGPSSVCP